jgi:hypothetical protein
MELKVMLVVDTLGALQMLLNGICFASLKKYQPVYSIKVSGKT